MILLNKIPVLDRGFVAKFDSNCNAERLNELAVEFFKRLDGKFLAEQVSTLTVLVKCPLFVQLNLSTFGLRITSLPNVGSDQLESYLPNVGEIGAPTLEVNQDIADDIVRTSAALMMNHKTYQTDGCNRFMSQILTPINTYTTLLVSGMYNDWCRYIAQSNAPAGIAAYVDAVNQIMKAEW